MITYYLGAEEVAAYNRDFAERLRALPKFPKQWFVLGLSGRKVFDALDSLLPQDLADSVQLGIAYLDRKTDQLLFSDQTPFEGIRSDEPVLILDAAVHSGRSMLKLVQHLQAAGAREFISYTLVLKRGAAIVPSYFGVVIDDKDRIYFELDRLPNNRLAVPPPEGVLRAVLPEDVNRPIADVAAPFVGLTIGDLIYDRDAHGAYVYLFEYVNEVVGFVSFRKNGGVLFVDSWFGATRNGSSGQKLKIGMSLFRWMETWARCARCERIELWAYEGAVEIYQFLGFKFAEPDWRILGEGQRYRVMNKKLLYNLKVTGEPDLEFR